VLKFPVPFPARAGRRPPTSAPTTLVIMARSGGKNWVNCGNLPGNGARREQSRRVDVPPGKTTAARSATSISSRGRPCPVLVSCGHDPMLFFLAGGNEFAFSGSSGIRFTRGGQPRRTVRRWSRAGLLWPTHGPLTRRSFSRERWSPAIVSRRREPFRRVSTGYYARAAKSEQPVISRAAHLSSRRPDN